MGKANLVEQEIDKAIDYYEWVLVESVEMDMNYYHGKRKAGITVTGQTARQNWKTRLRQQILEMIDEQIKYKGAGEFYVKPPLFRALRDNRKTSASNFCTTPSAKREAVDESKT